MLIIHVKKFVFSKFAAIQPAALLLPSWEWYMGGNTKAARTDFTTCASVSCEQVNDSENWIFENSRVRNKRYEFGSSHLPVFF